MIVDNKQLIDSVVRMLSHELGNPMLKTKSLLNDVCMDEGLDKSYKDTINRALGYLEQADQVRQRLKLPFSIQQYLPVSDREPLSLALIIKRVFAEFENSGPIIDIATVFEGDAWILGDEYLLLVLVRELLDNAQRFAIHSTPIRVGVCQKSKGNVQLTIETHSSLPTDPPPTTLFDPFTRNQSSQNGHFGLGLYIVKLIVDFYQGNTEVVDNNHTVTFIISFPAI